MFGISVHPGREIEARFAQASSIKWPITHRCIMERGWETTYLLFQLEISRGKETSAPKSHSEKKKKKRFQNALSERWERGEKNHILSFEWEVGRAAIGSGDMSWLLQFQFLHEIFSHKRQSITSSQEPSTEHKREKVTR